MRKRILLLLVLLSFFSSAAYSEMTLHFDLSPVYSMITNMYSKPLVQNADNSYLEYRRNDDPFIMRHDVGVRFNSSIFFSSSERVGLSIKAVVSKPVKSTKSIPSSADSSSWDGSYEVYENTGEENETLLFYIGPVFKLSLSDFDYGLSFSLSFGSFDFFTSFMDLGIAVEAFVSYHISESFYITGGLMMDSHLFSFYLNENENDYIYKPGYSRISLSPYIGAGLHFGGEK